MMRLLLVLFLLITPVACGGGQKNEEAPVNEAPAEGTEIVGLAQNAKLGAILLTSDGRVIYVDGLDAWPDDVLNKQVRARGRLEPKGGIPDVQDGSEEFAGVGDAEAWDLKQPSWSVIP